MIIFVCAVGVITTILVLSQRATTQSSNIQQESKSNNSETVTYEEFTGNYITASLPEGWSIKEHTDTLGTKDINNEIFYEADTEYIGLTGIEIFDQLNNAVFKLSGTGGIGDISACSLLPVFKDTEETYLDFIDEQNNFFIPPITIKYLDFKNAEYAELKLLGNRLRRVGNDYYHAYSSSDNHFNSDCAASVLDHLIVIENLNYTYANSSDNYIFNTYYYAKNKSISMEKNELSKLDHVLNSLEIK